MGASELGETERLSSAASSGVESGGQIELLEALFTCRSDPVLIAALTIPKVVRENELRPGAFFPSV